jgi:hypothetical protein
MRLRGLTYPIYRQTQGRVRLTLDSAHRIGPETTAKLPRGALALLEVPPRSRAPPQHRTNR